MNLPTSQNQPDLTQLTGLGRFLRDDGLGWVMNLFYFIFIFTVGQVGFGSSDLQTRLTQPDPLIFNMFLNYKNVYI